MLEPRGRNDRTSAVRRPCGRAAARRPQRNWCVERRLKRSRVVPRMLQPTKTACRLRSPLSTRRMVSPSASQFYGDTVRALTDAEVPFVVGGAFALKHYARVARDTKDLDVFLCRRDVPRALEALRNKG